jgi:hypothetical protein
MDAEFFHFLFGSGAAIKEKIVYFGLRLLGFVIADPGMYGRPSEYRFNWPFAAMYENPLTWSDLGVHTAIPFQIKKAFGIDIIYKPTDLICMCFDYNFESLLRIHYTYSRTIGVAEMAVYKRLDVFEPKFLTTGFKTYGRSIVYVIS